MAIFSRLSGYDWTTTPDIFRCYCTLYPFVENFKNAILDTTYHTVYIKHPYLFIYYEVGGYQGGNCWDDAVPTYITYDNEKPQLHNIFLELTGFQLQELNIETSTFTSYEYYGNSTDYEVIIIDLNKVKEIYQKYNLPSIL